MDPVRNPYAPGAGQQPPELAGRDAELRRLDVLLERAASGRPAPGLVLTGLRGVGKTVLLNAMRSRALNAGWATGKIEARPGVPLRAPLAAALHGAVREISGRARSRARAQRFLAVLKAFSLTARPDGAWQLAIDRGVFGDVPGGGATRRNPRDVRRVKMRVLRVLGHRPEIGAPAVMPAVRRVSVAAA